jgi:hypothetical protein
MARHRGIHSPALPGGTVVSNLSTLSRPRLPMNANAPSIRPLRDAAYSGRTEQSLDDQTSNPLAPSSRLLLAAYRGVSREEIDSLIRQRELIAGYCVQRANGAAMKVHSQLASMRQNAAEQIAARALPVQAPRLRRRVFPTSLVVALANPLSRHARESGHPCPCTRPPLPAWIPACAGMTGSPDAARKQTHLLSHQG